MVLILLVGINALLAGTEIALLSVNQNKIRVMADSGDKKAALLKKTIENPSEFLSTIQIGITLAGMLSGAFAANAFSDIFVSFLASKGIFFPALKQITTILITLILSYFQLVLGELVPKRIAMKKADAFALKIIGFVSVFAKITTPFVKLLSASTNIILKLIGINPEEEDEEVTEEEIRLMVDVGGETGMIDKSEKERINNIFEFDNKIADDISTHRKDILAISIDADEKEIFEVGLNDRFSRIPVYEDNIDNIIGILHVKDLAKAIVSGEENVKVDLKNIMRTPYFVPSSKKTDDLFEEMQANKIHIAIVVDEYGGTSGLVTMEDLIEEIMGSILDEYDEEEKPEIEALDSNTFLIQGTTDLETVSNFLNREFPIEEYDTVSGFVIGQLGRIPAEAEQPEILYEGVLFKVYAVEEKRIASVIVSELI